MRRTVALLVLVLIALPAAAHHRQTAAIVQFTFDGDNRWPRTAANGDRLVVALGAPGAKQVYVRQRDRVTFLAITSTGDNDNPTAALKKNIVAWDSDGDLLGNGSVGRQVYLLSGNLLLQAALDPTGTSRNPSLNGLGTRLAFEAAGDLVGPPHGGISQIFVRSANGSLSMASRGQGESRNPSFGRSATKLAFQSTSDPVTGNDTGVAQIWLLLPEGPAEPITDGAGDSTLPALSQRARLVAFQSTAALATDGHDTGVPQVFVYDINSGLFRQITNDAGGCHTPYVNDQTKAWRVTYVCGSKGYYTDIRNEARFELPITGGDTVQSINAGGSHFIQVATTANLLGGGSTAGHQLFQLNLFKLPAQPTQVGGIVTFTR
jgi:hypothetical protein